MPWNRAEIMASLRADRLDHWVDVVLARVRPAWRLDALLDAEPALGATKIGGGADLTDDEPWPVNRRGIAMTFVAQIDCSSLPSLQGEWPDVTGWNHGGRLVRIFADLVESPVEPCNAVVLTCEPGLALTREAAPPVPDPWPVGGPWDDAEREDRIGTISEVGVEPVATLMVSLEGLDEVIEIMGWAEGLRLEERDVHDDDHNAPQSHALCPAPDYDVQDPRHAGALCHRDPRWAAQLGLQPDPLLADAHAWTTLLVIYDDPEVGLEFYGLPPLCIIAPTVDLGAGRYDRLIACFPTG